MLQRSRSHPPDTGKERPFSGFHPDRFVFLLVVPSQQMEKSVDNHQRQLVFEGNPVPIRVAMDDGGGDEDVAELDRWTAPATDRWNARDCILDGKGQDIGRSLLPHEAFVEFRHLLLVDQDEKQMTELN